MLNKTIIYDIEIKGLEDIKAKLMGIQNLVDQAFKEIDELKKIKCEWIFKGQDHTDDSKTTPDNEAARNIR